jgi:hypothetical protein
MRLGVSHKALTFPWMSTHIIGSWGGLPICQEKAGWQPAPPRGAISHIFPKFPTSLVVNATYGY